MACDCGEVEDVDESCGHGDDDFGGTCCHGVRLAWESDDERGDGRVGGVVEMESLVPGCGDEDSYIY